MRTSVTILGATGSVGRSTADVLLAHRDRFRVEAVVGGRDAAGLAAAATSLGARYAALADPTGLAPLREALAGSGIEAGAGDAAVLEAVDREADVVVAAISGAAGLAPTWAAMRPGRAIALANKECLVSAGEAFMARARRLGVPVLPVDSEHNAIQQALAAGHLDDVTSVVITASGGPFRTWSAEQIAGATAAQALRHPVWAMGAKITIDSSTLMNKGLELIEAHHLFGIDAGRLAVLVHPQSIVHGLVHWRDGSVTAGLAPPDMRIPIVNCLGGARRLPLDRPGLDLARLGSLTFEPPDLARFRCLALAQAALAAGGGLPTVLNAANEVAVGAFIEGRIGFPDIARLVEASCEALTGRAAPATVEEALALDGEARQVATRLLPQGFGRAI